jgi:hypothetical protein
LNTLAVPILFYASCGGGPQTPALWAAAKWIQRLN